MEGGYCTIANYTFPSHCSHASKTNSDCKADCLSLESCVGFEFSTDHDFCYIYTSANNSCPSSYTFYEQEHFAMSHSDLEGVPDENLPLFKCYGKTTGTNNKPLARLLNFLKHINFENEPNKE